MYSILLVDDEPMICKGLTSIINESGLDILHIFSAHNGFEALDYLRIEDIDLLITDIQMNEMNGIELMQQAKILKPWVQTIVISAHEDFQYAQKAIRLGAKDYLIKPINNEHFLDTVRNALLNMKKTNSTAEEFIDQFAEDFTMQEPSQEATALLNDILSNSNDAVSNEIEQLAKHYHMTLIGPYFSVIKVKLNENDLANRSHTKTEAHLFRYATLNIIDETLNKECHHTSFYSSTGELTIILQWSEQEISDVLFNKISYLEMIGRTLNFNISKYLHVSCLVGISQILKGQEFLPDLNAQAEKAISWNVEHHDNHVFYYGDFNWSLYDAAPSYEDIDKQNNSIVNNVKDYIHKHYGRKGLTLNSIAQENHVSPNYLSYLFKKYTTYNLWEYVIQLRMEESKRLILHTDLRRYEIAERVGYESPEHFSKIFKKYFGKNLSDMRK